MPSDLWQTYFTSSKHVKRFRKDHSEPGVISIRKIFTNKDNAILWESKVLRRINAINKVEFINQTNNKAVSLAPCFGRSGDKHPMFGKKNPKASEVAKKTVVCPCCNKVGNIANMKRWHFNNCKLKITQKGETI